MALFVVIAPGKEARLQATLAAEFRDDFYRVSTDTFVVSARGLTSQGVSERLSITQGDQMGENAPAVVFNITNSYWGRFNPGLWEWLKVKVEATNA